MIIKNKLTGETLELTYHEFRKKFAKDFQLPNFVKFAKIPLEIYKFLERQKATITAFEDFWTKIKKYLHKIITPSAPIKLLSSLHC